MGMILTVLLNLKFEEMQEIGTPIFAKTKGKLQIHYLPKGVAFNYLSIHVYFYQGHYFLFKVMLCHN